MEKGFEGSEKCTGWLCTGSWWIGMNGVVVLSFFFLAFSCKTINDQGTLIGLKILSRLIEV